MKDSDKRLVEAAVQASTGQDKPPMVKQVPVAGPPEPVRLMFAADQGGVGSTADGRKVIQIVQFPFEVTLILSDEFKKMLLTGLTGGIELPS